MIYRNEGEKLYQYKKPTNVILINNQTGHRKYKLSCLTWTSCQTEQMVFYQCLNSPSTFKRNNSLLVAYLMFVNIQW